MSLADAIKREAAALGFDAVGISRVLDTGSQVAVDSSGAERPSGCTPPSFEPSARAPRTTPLPRPAPTLPRLLYDRLLDWLGRGYHGSMTWMARDPARRADPCCVLPGCRSIISLGLNYFTGHHPDERTGYGRIARYAWGTDYHDVFDRRLAQLESRIRALAPGAQTRRYADTGPVMEKAWAHQAGLGWIGKHSNLVSTRYGSWLLLGEVLTTLDLPPDEPGTDLCGSCTLCIRACPTGAITEPYVVDARRCISYLTIELRGGETPVPDELARRMGNRIFGCDDCLDVCPYNAQATPTYEPAFQPSAGTLAPQLDQLSQMTEPQFASTFRHSPIRRPRYGGVLRNIRIALRNQRAAEAPGVPASLTTSDRPRARPS